MTILEGHDLLGIILNAIIGWDRKKCWDEFPALAQTLIGIWSEQLEQLLTWYDWVDFKLVTAFEQEKDFAFHQQGVWFPIFKIEIKKIKTYFN